MLSARRRLADALGRSSAFWFANGKEPVVLDDDELQEPGFSGVVNSLFRHFAASKGAGLRWGEKSPMYLQHIDLLAASFPGAQFIHIYRDGRDVAQSFHRRYKKEPRWTIYRWKKILQMGRIQGQKLGVSRYMEVSYETLTSDPEANLRQICEFLHLPYHPILRKAASRRMDPDKRADFIVPNSEQWRSYFSDKELRELELIAGDTLSELGYTIATSAGSMDPSARRLLWWRLSDPVKLSWIQFRKRGLRFTPIFFKRALLAIRQGRANYY